MSEFLLVLILIIAVLIYLNLRLKILPLVQAKNLARINFSKRYAEVDFIVPQLRNESYSLKSGFDFVNEPTSIGRLGLCQTFQVKSFCKLSELSKGVKFFEGSIVVTQVENFSEIPTVFDGDIVRFIVLDNNIFDLQIKCSSASFNELRHLFSANHDTTLRITNPYFIKQKVFDFYLGGTGVSIKALNFSSDYGDSIYTLFLKQYQSANGNIAHDSIYKAVSELMVIRRKSQTQLRAEVESLAE
jgi:hypothetical protein